MNSYRVVLVKLVIFFVVAVLISVSVVATLLDRSSLNLFGLTVGQPSKSYNALFSNASGLESGDTVRIAGVEVGKVNGVSVVPGSTPDSFVAKVTFSAFSAQHLTTTTTAQIQFENLLGQRYLQLSQPPPRGAPLKGGATIPLSQTQPGLDLTTVFTGFQPLIAALNPEQVNELTGSIIQVLQGESGAVSNLVTETASLTNNLASRQTLIDQILDNLTPLLKSVNTDDTQIAQIIDGLNTLATGLAGERQQVGDAVTGLSNLTTATSHLLTNVQPTLDHDLGGLQTATGSLLANQNGLNSVITNLPATLNALDKAASSGSYLSVYVCDLKLELSGPLSVKLSPTVPQSPPLSVPAGFVGNQADHTAVCQ